MAKPGADYAPLLADPDVISELERLIDDGREIRMVIGPATYIAIHNNPEVRASLNILIKKGAHFAYSPYAAPGEIAGVFDGKNAIMSTNGGINAMESSHPSDISHVRSRMGKESTRALPLSDFESAIGELAIRYSQFFA